jgi:hypothetical protein
VATGALPADRAALRSIAELIDVPLGRRGRDQSAPEKRREGINTNTCRPGGDEFPCASLSEALPQLRRRPASAAVRFKIQNAAEQAAQVAAYIDARLVYDRLDLVCADQWSARFEALPKALIPPPVDRHGELREPPPIHVRCRLTLFGVTREDVGEGQNPKAAFSDAIKRAAVQFGVAGAVRAAAAMATRRRGRRRTTTQRGGRLLLDRRSEQWCREMYGRWLTERGKRLFGEPLHHGDELGARGFEPGESADAVRTASEATSKQGQQQVPPSDSTARAGEGRASAPTGSKPVGGRLVAVSTGTLGDPPATALDRRQIAQWRQAGHYREETIAAVSTVLYGEPLDRLSHAQPRDLAMALEFGARRSEAGRPRRGRRADREVGRADAGRGRAACLARRARQRARAARPQAGRLMTAARTVPERARSACGWPGATVLRRPGTARGCSSVASAREQDSSSNAAARPATRPAIPSQHIRRRHAIRG